MDEIQATARFKIHDGKLEEFKAVAAELLAITRDKDTGTREYDWFFSADQSECVVRERYADSAAVLDHIAHVGDKLGAVLGLGELTLDVYGDPSPELREAIKALNPRVFPYFQGL